LHLTLACDRALMSGKAVKVLPWPENSRNRPGKKEQD
jgi:hypothetical protein